MANRRDLFKLVALLAPTASGAKLPSDTLPAAKAKLTREAFGDLRVFFNGPTDQLHAMTAGSLELKPGMSPHPPHQHEEEEIMVITEGSGEIVVDGKTSAVASGSMMYSAANKLHGITNTGKTPLLFYYFKWKA
jgi:mannose-6-phosphate isomerase-like protein (cupin superfamily)